MASVCARVHTILLPINTGNFLRSRELRRRVQKKL